MMTPEIAIGSKGELTLFKIQMWGDDPIVFKSSAKRGDEGFFLALAIAKTLASSDKLSRVELTHPDVAWERFNHHIVSANLPYCDLNGMVHSTYHEDLLVMMYEQLDGRLASDPDLLNLWVRAWSGNATEVFELIQASKNLPVLASLVERGGNPLWSIKL